MGRDRLGTGADQPLAPIAPRGQPARVSIGKGPGRSVALNRSIGRFYPLRGQQVHKVNSPERGPIGRDGHGHGGDRLAPAWGVGVWGDRLGYAAIAPSAFPNSASTAARRSVSCATVSARAATSGAGAVGAATAGAIDPCPRSALARFSR